MGNLLLRAITAVQLTRLTLAFGAVSDIWLVILLSRVEAAGRDWPVVEMPLPLVLLVGATIAIGLYAHGTALNDVLDIRHDAAFSPQRPIPSGRIRAGQAVVLAIGSLLTAILAAAALGTIPVCLALLAAAALLFFNTVGKYIPAFGILTVGFIHAATMLVPNYRIEFILPVWLSMTHTMVIAMAVHWYEEKRPQLSARSMLAVAGGWAFMSAALLSSALMEHRVIWPEGVAPLNAIYPAMAVLGWVAMARWKTRNVAGAIAGEKLKRYGALWQSLYAAAWLGALELHVQAMWMGAFALAGFAAMTILREITGLSGRPIAYR